MSRIARIAAGVVLAATAFSTAPASAEFPPDCTVEWEGQRFGGPGGGTWYMEYPVIVCAQ